MSWMNRVREEGKALKAYAEELENRLKKATEILADVGAGLTYTDVTRPEWSSDVKLRVMATTGLKTVGGMPLRKKPSSWYF